MGEKVFDETDSTESADAVIKHKKLKASETFCHCSF